VIVDIGLAKHESSATKITESGDPLIGTPAYLAPEVITGAAVDGRADIYSVGMLLWEMLAGQPARQPGELFEVLRRAVAEDVNVEALSMASPELREVMGTMLARQPEHRWQTAGLARGALLKVPELVSFPVAPDGHA
jgi:eukaryotic-like serine/threonine-protein kinase